MWSDKGQFTRFLVSLLAASCLALQASAKAVFAHFMVFYPYVRMVTLSHDTKSQTRLATQQDMPYQTGRMISLLPKRLISMPSLSTLLMERR